MTGSARRCDAAIFDLVGTLADTLADIAEAVIAGLSSMDLPTHPEEAYRDWVGEGVEHLAALAMPASHHPQMGELVRRFRAYYAEHVVQKSRAFPEVPAVLEALRAKGVLLAVLSNKMDLLTRRIVQVCFGDALLHPVYGERQGVARKPDPSAALGIASELGVEPARCLFVGDTAVDMNTARAAGMYGVGVTWGFRGREELEQSGAKVIIEAPGELLRLV